MDKKKIIVLIIALLAIAGIVYMTFFHKSASSPGTSTVVDASGNVVSTSAVADNTNLGKKNDKMSGITY